MNIVNSIRKFRFPQIIKFIIIEEFLTRSFVIVIQSSVVSDPFINKHRLVHLFVVEEHSPFVHNESFSWRPQNAQQIFSLEHFSVVQLAGIGYSEEIFFPVVIIAYVMGTDVFDVEVELLAWSDLRQRVEPFAFVLLVRIKSLPWISNRCRKMLGWR